MKEGPRVELARMLLERGIDVNATTKVLWKNARHIMLWLNYANVHTYTTAIDEPREPCD